MLFNYYLNFLFICLRTWFYLKFWWKWITLFNFWWFCLLNFQINSKYSDELAQECLEWVREITGEAINVSGDMDNFYETLKDGVLLCKLVNTLKPGTVKKINESKMAFKCMENINGEFKSYREKYQITNMYFKRIPWGCKRIWCTCTRNIPNCRLMGTTKSQLSCYLSAVTWKKGEPLNLVVHKHFRTPFRHHTGFKFGCGEHWTKGGWQKCSTLFWRPIACWTGNHFVTIWF